MSEYDDVIYSQPPQSQYYGPSMMPQMQDATIAEKRWEGDQLAWELYKVLSGKMPVRREDGQVDFVRINEQIKPVLNDLGVERVISLVRACVNTVVALTKFTDEECNAIIRQTEDSLAKLLVLNQTQYELEDNERDFVYNNIRILVRAQLKRPQNGHEAGNFRTQTIQQEQHSFHENKNSGGFSLFPGSKSRG